jgi:hypothetical protein
MRPEITPTVLAIAFVGVLSMKHAGPPRVLPRLTVSAVAE